METTGVFEKAVALATAAHRGQKRKDGADYITHPLRVAESVKGADAKVVAVLHDVLEDTPTTEADLRAAGIPERCIEALRLLNHDEAVPYLEYVAALQDNPLAKTVKIADLWDNFRARHAIPDPEKRRRLASRYVAALELLLTLRPVVTRDRRSGMPFPERGREMRLTFKSAVRGERAWWAYREHLRACGATVGALGELAALRLHDSPLKVHSAVAGRGKVCLRVHDYGAWEEAEWKGRCEDFTVDLCFEGVSAFVMETAVASLHPATVDMAGLAAEPGGRFRWVVWLHALGNSTGAAWLSVTFRTVRLVRRAYPRPNQRDLP